MNNTEVLEDVRLERAEKKIDLILEVITNPRKKLNEIIRAEFEKPKLEASEKLKNPSQASVQLTGQNLESYGIFDNDFLVFDFNEKARRASFVMLWQNADYHCFFVESLTKTKVCLSNDRAEIAVKPNEILGRVIRMERDL